MYQLTEALPYLLNRVGVKMGELFSRRLDAYGVTLPMYRVMAALWQRGGLRLGELSEATSVDSSTLSRQVGALSSRGLVSRRRIDSNGRVVEIALTPAGAALVDTLIPLAEAHERASLLGFQPAEVTVLKQALARIYDNLAEVERDLPAGAPPRP